MYEVDGVRNLSRPAVIHNPPRWSGHRRYAQASIRQARCPTLSSSTSGCAFGDPGKSHPEDQRTRENERRSLVLWFSGGDLPGSPNAQRLVELDKVGPLACRMEAWAYRRWPLQRGGL